MARQKGFGSGWIKTGDRIGGFIVKAVKGSHRAGQRLAGIKRPMKIKTLARKIVSRKKYK